ncbi:hypothetical protein L1987_03809 [Smallanthus sonchifolius]|uniref:Uncharacterized protein n=1 Tax=Smallanthus sonchifolius TaxID=185202 RepID=A0ACB9KBJ3_9ASTR|nr:hypothetical protein L1987_03809 [Smallanthus sonchifolius]
MLKARMMFRVMLIMIIKGVLMKAVMGKVYNVGDSEGWAILVESNYATWTTSKKFRVGDTLLFHYNLTNHDVRQVNQQDFRSCNITAPWKTYETGNDSFVIRTPGHYYFICSFPSHCEAGQKLDVRVLKSYYLTTTPRTNVSSPVPPNTTTIGSRSVGVATDPNCLLCSIVVLSTIYAAMWVGFWVLEMYKNEDEAGVRMKMMKQEIMEAMKMMMLAVVMAVITAAMGGEVYMVGDDEGWTSVGQVDYKSWASTKLFRVGDTIVFQYAKIFHDVARVSYTDFLTCNATSPYTTFTSGKDSFTIKYPGHYFFICTQSTHCQGGQKVDIRVPVAGGHSVPQPTTADSPAPLQPLPFPYPQPYVPSPSPVAPPPAPLQAPAPSLSRDLPAPTPAVPAPEQKKNIASQLGFGFKIWSTIMVVWFYLVGFGF